MIILNYAYAEAKPAVQVCDTRNDDGSNTARQPYYLQLTAYNYSGIFGLGLRKFFVQ
jgi:hypothetical protein